MTAKEVREALAVFAPSAEVLVRVNRKLHHLAVGSVGLGVGGLPTILAVEMPGKDAGLKGDCDAALAK